MVFPFAVLLKAYNESSFDGYSDYCAVSDLVADLPSIKSDFNVKEWLSSFNTNSATVCFTEIQELKKRLEGEEC